MNAASTLSVSLLLASIAVSGCSRRYYYDDGDRPRIATTSPGDNETGVSIEALVRVVFTERMWSSSIDRTSFYVSRASDNAVVEGAIRLEDDDRTAVFTPIQFLEPGVRYEVVVTEDVESRYYGFLSRDARFSFTTASTAQATLSGGGLQFMALNALYLEALAGDDDGGLDAVGTLTRAADVTTAFAGSESREDDSVVVALAMRLAGPEVIAAVDARAAEGDAEAMALTSSMARLAVQQLLELTDSELVQRLR